MRRLVQSAMNNSSTGAFSASRSVTPALPMVARTRATTSRAPGVARMALMVSAASALSVTPREKPMRGSLASRPASFSKSSWTPANSIWMATAPATATVTPLTVRAAVPLLSCSLRMASCQESGPPRKRFTKPSTSHGSSAVTPTRTSTAPAAT